MCMPDDRIPKQLLFGELGHGKHRHGHQYLRFKYSLKSSLKSCSIHSDTFEPSATDRVKQLQHCHQSLDKFERSSASHIKVEDWQKSVLYQS